MIRKSIVALILVAPQIFAQGKQKGAPKPDVKPYTGQSASTFSLSTKDKEQTVEISNVTYEVTGTGIPGRPLDERMVLRKSTRTKHVVDDIGEEASTTVEAWPLGSDFKQKPIYSLKVDGVDPLIVQGEVLQVSRGLEEVEWWSLFKLANGEHLFDTYTPLTKFSISREIQTLRYVGLDVPPDNAADARLKDPHVVAVLTYASATKVIREALITADDPKQAQLLRSYADSARILEAVERDAVVRSLRVTIRQNFPSAPNPVVLTIPLAGDDLDAAHAQVPARLHIAAWKR
jgi:hypothetical protein